MKLQSNFTTPEQSKRLLELGVPADSADMYYHKDIGFTDFHLEPEVIPAGELFSTGNTVYIYDIPCWSVGRLIEIYEIVGENAGQCVTTTKGTSRLENLVQLYEENATLLDFSKLEE